jgi:hypothetical protein
MTAEIAILNKTAVALAADSAVTIGSGANAKIYNTVNKIFELSETCPVGIMVFNRLDFMNIPLEVLIKEYRKSRRQTSFKNIIAWRDDFIKYLSSEVKYTAEDERENIETIIRDAIDILAQRFNASFNRHISTAKKYLPSKMNGLLIKETNFLISFYRSKQFSDTGTTKKLPADLDLAVEEITSQYLHFSITAASTIKIKEYIGYVLSKDVLSSYRTGIVIAGFGDEEIFPSLSHIEIDGIVCGKLKKNIKNHVDIDRRGTHAEILGFAQDDMVQSFVNGVDPQYRDYTVKIIREAIEETAKIVLTPVLNNQIKTDEIIAKIKPDFEKLSVDYSKKSDNFINSRFTQEIKSMVRAMPKQDLATLAESLIEITSLKRKVTRARETVGGDVDVAVISKSEGLVWVRRKHYFPSDINSRFFSRHFK